MAAGLTLSCERLSDFRRAFSEAVRTRLTAQDFIPKIAVSALAAPADWTVETVEELALLEPYGMGNPRPIFGVRNVRPQKASSIGAEGKHLRMDIGTREHHITALYWNAGDLAAVLTEEDSDLAYTPGINEWQGERSVQCMVDTVTPAAHERIFPERELLRRIYAFLRSLAAEDGTIRGSAPVLTHRFSYMMEHISHYTMDCALQIFLELGVLNVSPEGWNFIPPRGKMELMDAPTYRRHHERKEAAADVR